MGRQTSKLFERMHSVLRGCATKVADACRLRSLSLCFPLHATTARFLCVAACLRCVLWTDRQSTGRPDDGRDTPRGGYFTHPHALASCAHVIAPGPTGRQCKAEACRSSCDDCVSLARRLPLPFHVRAAKLTTSIAVALRLPECVPCILLGQASEISRAQSQAGLPKGPPLSASYSGISLKRLDGRRSAHERASRRPSACRNKGAHPKCACGSSALWLVCAASTTQAWVEMRSKC